jgi:hypothetical protein
MELLLMLGMVELPISQVLVAVALQATRAPV